MSSGVNIMENINLPLMDWQRLSKFSAMMKKVNVDDNGCWVYKSKNRPQTRMGGKIHAASRVMYALWHGIDLRCETVRHLCSNSFCVNPDHLLPGTYTDNLVDTYYPSVIDMILRLEECGYTVTKIK